jgi:enoyl-CoA hydratase
MRLPRQRHRRFPQTACADRLSALQQWDLEGRGHCQRDARRLEVIASGETLSGATRFASGIGRHGKFGGDLGNG